MILWHILLIQYYLQINRFKKYYFISLYSMVEKMTTKQKYLISKFNSYTRNTYKSYTFDRYLVMGMIMDINPTESFC